MTDTRVLLLATALILPAASAAEELPSPGMAYCSLYAREAVRIDIMHTMPIDARSASSSYIEAMAVQVYKQCISVVPTLLPLPPEHRSLKSWEADISQWVISRLGTKPAEGRADGPQSGPDHEEWTRQCAAEYRTWDPDTETVVRSGSSERVKCPCGTEVQCNVTP